MHFQIINTFDPSDVRFDSKSIMPGGYYSEIAMVEIGDYKLQELGLDNYQFMVRVYDDVPSWAKTPDSEQIYHEKPPALTKEQAGYC